jgi:hypothetical protein
MGGGDTVAVNATHNGGNPGAYGALGMPSSGNVPGGRYLATGWTDRYGYQWLFGGFGHDANDTTGYLNDLWQFSSSTNEWAWMGGSSTTPSYFGNSGVYGTFGVPSAANIPGGREGASSWTDSVGRVWLFGGVGFAANNGAYLNDLWMFQPTAPSSLTLASSMNPSPYGQPVTLTAAVSPSSATGTVQFVEAPGAVLGTVDLVSGSASMSIGAFPVGASSLTAIYSGDANYTRSTSTPLTQTVTKATSSVAITSSINPSTSGQAVTFIAIISPFYATGTVQFLDGTTSLGIATIALDWAALSVSTLAVGPHSITAVYSGDANCLTSGSAALAQTVNQAASRVILTPSVNPAVYGQSVTFQATVSPASATGTVQFLDGATSLGTATIASGSAIFAISTLSAGAHSITAAYGGDANNPASASAAVLQTVNKVASSLTLTVSPNPSAFGQSVTLKTTVSPASATGTVQFQDGITSLGTATIANGTATLAISTLAAGTHSITAVYGGSTNYAGSTSTPLSLTVMPPLPAAPTKLTATAASSSQINLAWTASSTSGVTYNVYASATPGFTASAATRVATGLTAANYSNTGLAPSTTYYYLVTARNSAGESAPTNQASAKTAESVSCHITYLVTTQWSNGFETALTIKNSGNTSISGWNLTWTWSGNQQITQSWDASYTQKGTNSTLSSESYDGTIAPGATIRGIGFNASYSGANAAPSKFYLNGTLCK